MEHSELGLSAPMLQGFHALSVCLHTEPSGRSSSSQENTLADLCYPDGPDLHFEQGYQMGLGPCLDHAPMHRGRTIFRLSTFQKPSHGLINTTKMSYGHLELGVPSTCRPAFTDRMTATAASVNSWTCQPEQEDPSKRPTLQGQCMLQPTWPSDLAAKDKSVHV